MEINKEKYIEMFKNSQANGIPLELAMESILVDMQTDIITDLTASVKDFNKKRFVFGDEIELRVYNDGKEKHQSFEVSIDIDKYGLDFVDVRTGYGSSEAEALQDFLSNWQAYNTNHLNVAAYIHADKYKLIETDFAGTPLLGQEEK